MLCRARICRFRHIATSLLVAGLWAAAFQRPLPAQDPLEAYESQQYREVILSPEPLDGDSLYSEDSYCCPEPDHPWLLRFRTGASYFDTTSAARLGGMYGADAILPLYRRLAVYGGASANHFSEGSQYLGTFGLLKVSSGCSPFCEDRFGWGVLFDNFTDTRFDSPHLSQLRTNFNVALTGRNTVGLTWYEPISDEDIEVAPGLTSPFFGSQAVEMYASHRLNAATVVGSIGYRDEVDAVTYGGHAHVPVGDRVNLLAQAHYQDVGVWSGFVGLEILLGSRRSAQCGYQCAAVQTADRRGGTAEIVPVGGIVGDFFFEKDADGDGTLTKNEKFAYLIVALNIIAGREAPGGFFQDTDLDASVDRNALLEYLENNSVYTTYGPADYSSNTNGPDGGAGAPPDEGSSPGGDPGGGGDN